MSNQRDLALLVVPQFVEQRTGGREELIAVAVVDRVGSERHELSGRAKDIASATVFLALINIVLIWGILLLDF